MNLQVGRRTYRPLKAFRVLGVGALLSASKGQSLAFQDSGPSGLVVLGTEGWGLWVLALIRPWSMNVKCLGCRAF